SETNVPRDETPRSQGTRKPKSLDAWPAGAEGGDDREIAHRDEQLSGRNLRLCLVRRRIGSKSEVSNHYPRSRSATDDSRPDRAEPAPRQRDTESGAAGLRASGSCPAGLSTRPSDPTTPSTIKRAVLVSKP